MAPSADAGPAGPLPETYLLLDVAGTACALPRAAVREVLPLPDLSPAPAEGSWLVGFLNLGGEPVPVVDLARLLGLRAGPAEPGAYAHLVLAAAGGLALLVDRASDLVSVEAAHLRPAPAGRSLNGCVVAEIAQGERLLGVLDLAAILTAEETARLDALARAAGERLSGLPAGLPAGFPSTSQSA